jgi:hypothetical protein
MKNLRFLPSLVNASSPGLSLLIFVIFDHFSAMAEKWSKLNYQLSKLHSHVRPNVRMWGQRVEAIPGHLYFSTAVSQPSYFPPKASTICSK